MENLPSNFDSDMKMAQMLIKSGYVPKDVNRPEQVLFLMLIGRDMNLSAVQSLRHVRMIQGKPELSADIQLGKFLEQGGKFKWLKLTDTEAHLWLQSPSSLEPHVSTFNMDEAKRAGLLSNQTWQKYPKAMLRSRAITQGLKDIGFILGAGVYAPGEIGGHVQVDERTGEVLPGEYTVAEQVAAVDIAGDLSAHATKALSAEQSEGVTLTSSLIAQAIKTANTTSALNVYLSIDDAEEKIAVKSALKNLLTKDELKIFRDAYTGYCKEQIKNMPAADTDTDTPYHEWRRAKEPVVLGAEPDLNDVRAHIRAGDMDLAADVAHCLTDPVLRKTAEDEVLLAGALKRNKVPA